ncbi:FAD/NAD-P-binding domain-containing protein [Mycena floridula]|nr:FAD/NAD-P-binding domain-containing protein [Mycena floridula]
MFLGVPLALLSLALPSASQWGSQIVLDDRPSIPDSKYTVFNHTIKRVAVIGAGPAGLQAAAELIKHNFSVRLFERAPGPGGNWLYSDEVPVRESYPDAPVRAPEIPQRLPATKFYKEGQDGITLDERWREHWLPRPVWDTLHTNSPAVITELPDVPYPRDQPWVISHYRIQSNVRAYASFHNLNSNDENGNVTSYATRVEWLQRAHSDGVTTWTLTLRRLERLPESNRIKATWWTEDFDAVVIGTGPYTDPHVPDIKGLVEWSTIKEDGRYSVYHSRTYRRPERYAGKTVLVVGTGTSGSEIARDLDGVAHKILATKRAHDIYTPFQIRSLRRFPDSTEFVPEIASLEPIADSEHGIRNGKIVLVNGTVLEGIDEIILATGYNRANAFLVEFLNKTAPALKDKDEEKDPFDGGLLPNVHWTGHYIPDPTLVFTNVRPWTIGQYQSLGFAKVWEGTARIPNTETLWKQYRDSRWRSFRGLFGTINSEAIFRQFIAWLNSESLELGGRFVDTWPVENREVFVYYANQQWLGHYISADNFTDFENLPAKEWGKAKAAVWDASVLEDVSW